MIVAYARVFWMRIAYQGEPGAYSEAAALAFDAEATPVPCKSFEDVFQAVAGNQLYQKSDGAPEWAKTGHRVGATALATVFGVNTVTGLWNLWDSRAVSQGRTRRTIHTLLMLASDAGFAYAGIKLADEAENSAEKRKQHRNLAFASMGVAITGSGMMLLWRD